MPALASGSVMDNLRAVVSSPRQRVQVGVQGCKAAFIPLRNTADTMIQRPVTDWEANKTEYQLNAGNWDKMYCRGMPVPSLSTACMKTLIFSSGTMAERCSGNVLFFLEKD